LYYEQRGFAQKFPIFVAIFTGLLLNDWNFKYILISIPWSWFYAALVAVVIQTIEELDSGR